MLTHGIITQNTNHRNTTYLYRGHSASTSLEKGEEEDKESNRKRLGKDSVQSKEWCPSHKLFCVLFSVTQSFLPGFSWSSDKITVSKKKSTSKKEATSISKINVSYLHKHFIIPLLCQCRVFIHTCVSKNSVVSKDVIFYLLWYNVIQWSSHICTKCFLSFYSFLVKFSA